MKFTSFVVSQLKYYVYIYSNPITGEIFYVGKGKGNRAFSHLEDTTESDKVRYINELRKQGYEPKIEILIHGLEDEITAFRVEASIIDLIGINNLTNKQSGYKSSTFGRMTIQQLKSTYEKEKVEITEPSILIRINQKFRYSMSEIELFDITRGYWKLNPERAKDAKYGFAVYEGIIQEVYTIIQWLPAGSTFNVRDEEVPPGRFEFIGNIADEEVRRKYRYKSVEHYFKRGNSNPIMYVNVEDVLGKLL